MIAGRSFPRSTGERYLHTHLGSVRELCLKSCHRFLHGNTDQFKNLASDILANTTVRIAHFGVLGGWKRKFDHIDFIVIKDGDLITVSTCVAFVSLWERSKINHLYQPLSIRR